MTDALVSFVVEELGAIVKDEVVLLADVKKELKSLSNTFSAIQALLADAERKQVTREGVRDWLGKIKEVAYEVEDILDEWRTDAFTSEHDEDEDGLGKIQKVRSCSLFPCLCFKQVKLRHDIGHRIREVRERLNEISEEKSKFNLEEVKEREVMSGPIKVERETGSFINESETFGRDEVKERIINQLVSETSGEEKSVSIVSIVGMGGLGKTTLARLLYNDERVMAHFEKRIWVCVSDPFDVKRIAIKVIESMSGSTSNNPDLDTLQHSLRAAIDKKRFLLVLDDVWNDKYALWEKLKNPLMGAGQGSKVVVTTRIHQVAVAMETPRINVHKLGVLSYSDCWKLFHSRALEGTEEENSRELMEIGEKIVRRCKGVPLAVKAVGSLLRSTKAKPDWELVFVSKIWDWGIANDDTHKNDILPALLLSYYNLPPCLKRCFSFCSVFPKDHEIKKDELVKLWMAHGIIKSEKAKKDVTEEIGARYFDYLLTRSLFQDAEEDIDGNIVRCKMHDLVHDLATFVGSGDYCSMEAGDSELSSIKCHHLSLVNYGMSSIPSPRCSAERLRTLLLFGFSKIKEVPSFNHLKFLRALDLRGTMIENLPSSLGKLKYLRYLDLSKLNITELPESVSDLCNLQTLKLNKCWDLRSLPSGISKMVKLRHLEIEGTTNLKVLPNGIRRLTSLRTLCKFPVGDEENRGCKIVELKNLNLLRGELRIENLERVMNVNDAREAKLHKKSDLHVLSLCCNDKSDEEWRTLGDDEMKRMDSVLGGLTPPNSNLKKLKIKNYAGSKFPSWLDLEGSRFSSLVKVVLKNCRKCMLLPSHGKLLSLKYLKIIGADEVKVVDREFYGIVNDARAKETRFPKLEELHFESMLNWEEWWLTQEYGEVMPSLKKLKIINCKKLKATPNCLPSTLREVTIENCNEVIWAQDSPLPHLLRFTLVKVRGMPSKALSYLTALETLCLKELSCELPSNGWGLLESLHTLTISHFPELASLPEELVQLKALQTLHIENCKRLSSLPGLGKLHSLKYLKIIGADEVKVVDREFYGIVNDARAKEKRFPKLEELHFESLLNWEEWWLTQEYGEVMPSLKKLKIIDCKKLKAMPNCLPTNLREVTIQYCNEVIWAQDSPLPHLLRFTLVKVRGMPSKALSYLTALETLCLKELSCELPSNGWGLLESLHTLTISHFPELASLPDGLGQLKALQTLKIRNCERLSYLPEGLGQLKALHMLKISKCIRSSLPERLGQLKALQTLSIKKCKKLSSLPEELRQLKALQTLLIRDCEQLSSLFDGFEQLRSLCELNIWDCPLLRLLPNLKHLTSLETLSIQNCPLLTERLEKEKGEDWCKISHIPRIHIDTGDIERDAYLFVRAVHRSFWEERMKRSATSGL